MKRIIVFLIMVLMLGINTVSADTIDNIPISIKVNFIGTNNTVAKSILISSPNYENEVFFSTLVNNAKADCEIRYLSSISSIIKVPVNITAIYTNSIFDGMSVIVNNDDGAPRIKLNMNVNNSYMNFTYPLTVSSNGSSSYSNTDLERMFNLTLSRMDKNFKSSNEDFSSTFIQYFSNQYEPKMQELKEKDSQIESLRNEVRMKDERINMMSVNYTVVKSQFEDAKSENMFLAFFSVVLLVMMVSFLAVKRGFIKTMKGVN